MPDSFIVDRQAVFDWINAPPYQDPDRLLKQPSFDYRAWSKRGKSLPRATEILIEILNSQDLAHPTNDSLRAARGLAYAGDKRKGAVDALLRLLGSNNILVREAAVFALGLQGAGNRDVAKVLERVLADRKEATNVRANAAMGLGRLGLLQADAILQRTTTDEDDFVALCAKEALKILHGTSQ